MMDKFSLNMVLHCHQPVGNFDHVLAYAVKRCYRPVLDILARYPEFRFGLHFSGPLLSWLEKNDPALLDQAAEMANKGQAEMLSGGYYEPLLAVIPQRDAVAQVKKQTAYTRERFGQYPKGFWLAERIWEPGLPAKLAACGLDYTLVDDTHFYYAGLEPGDMFGYRITEREGHPLALFPTHKELRYTIPFKEPGETLEFLRRALDEHGPTCATYGDDVEKFGLWPDTYEWVIEKGWLARFVEAVLGASDWLDTGLPGEFMARNPSSGRIYLPTASYEEMLTWALPAAASEEMEKLIKSLEREGRLEGMRQFLRGGVWDNFLVKYPESNFMHKRMLFVSDKLEREGGPAEAYDHLLQAQCNCAYWHGLFGGLYLGHLRHAVHQHLIAAEKLIDARHRPGGDWTAGLEKDLDLDGNPEVILSSAETDLVIHPSYGGSVSVFDLRPRDFNLAGALTRRREAYHAHFTEPHDEGGKGGEPKSIHDQIVFKEEGLEDYLIYDWCERRQFQDHFIPRGTPLADFAKAAHAEWGDFVNQPYILEELKTGPEDSGCRLTRSGNLWAPGGPWPLELAKTYRLSAHGGLKLGYALNVADGAPPSWLGVELNFSLLSESDPDKHVLLAGGERKGLDAPWESEPVMWLELVDKVDGFSVRLEASSPARLWCFPVETVSMSESGLERTYQGSSLTLLWPLEEAARGLELSLSPSYA